MYEPAIPAAPAAPASGPAFMGAVTIQGYAVRSSPVHAPPGQTATPETVAPDSARDGQTAFEFQPRTRLVFGRRHGPAARRHRLGPRVPAPAAGGGRWSGRGRTRGAGGTVARGRRHQRGAISRVRREPRYRHDRRRVRGRPAPGDRRHHRPGRRQFHGLRQGHQFSPDQRRPDGRLSGIRQGGAAAVADDRHPDDRRYRQ